MIAAYILTFVRLPLAAAVWIAPHSAAYVLALMVAAGVSDVLDGWLARRAGAHGGAGTWLDPLCDKVFVVSALVAVWVTYRPAWYVLPLVGAREILLMPTIFVLRRRRYDFTAAVIGKLATVAQFVAVAAVMIRPSLAPALAVVAALVGTAAAGWYFRRALRQRT